MQQRLLPHANRCIQQLSNVKVPSATENQDIDYAFNNLGGLYADQGKMAEVEEMYQQALEEMRKHEALSLHPHSARSSTWAFSMLIRVSWLRPRGCISGHRRDLRRLKTSIIQGSSFRFTLHSDGMRLSRLAFLAEARVP